MTQLSKHTKCDQHILKPIGSKNTLNTSKTIQNTPKTKHTNNNDTPKASCTPGPSERDGFSSGRVTQAGPAFFHAAFQQRPGITACAGAEQPSHACSALRTTSLHYCWEYRSLQYFVAV